MLHLLRRIAAILLAAVVSVAALAGIAAAGVAASMSESFTRPPSDVSTPPRPAPDPIPAGRITVAVALGATGSVAADVLAPYEVFARSDAFSAYTVAADRAPAALSGGLHLLADRTFDEVTIRPDVVVVPAVVDATGAEEAALRSWVTTQAARGSRVLGVCAGSRLLAGTGLLDGRRATSFWSDITALERDHPQVRWVRGQRYVEDGPMTTTAGVTSGVLGALHLVERLAGADEAERIGADLAYPGWSPDGPTAIGVHRWDPSDLPYLLNVAFPWLRPTVGIGLVDGVSEIDVAAAAEVHSGVSFAARAVPIGARPAVVTRHGLVLVAHRADATAPPVDRLVVPGATDAAAVDPHILRWASDRALRLTLPGGGSTDGSGFDPVLHDLARHADRASALATAKFLEYPAGHLSLTGPAWPWRPTALFGAALLLSLGLGSVAGRAVRAIPRRSSAPRPAGAPARRSGPYPRNLATRCAKRSGASTQG